MEKTVAYLHTGSPLWFLRHNVVELPLQLVHTRP